MESTTCIKKLPSACRLERREMDQPKLSANPLEVLVGPARLELATKGL